MLGGRLLRKGQLTQAEIARRLGVSSSAVNQWSQILRQQGLAGLRRKPLPGRKPRLTAEDWRYLLEVLRHGASAAGWRTDRWSWARIGVLLKRTFGVKYNPRYLSGRLNALGFSCVDSRDAKPDQTTGVPG